MSMSREERRAYDNGVATGTDTGRQQGRVGALEEIEQLALSMLEGLPKYTDPDHLNRIVNHCRKLREQAQRVQITILP